MTQHVTILDRKEALRRAGGISKSTLLRLQQADPTFPKPVRLSPRRVGYYEHEWSAWLEQRARTVRTDGATRGPAATAAAPPTGRSAGVRR